MAKRKQVKQCRFYVDLLSYFHAIGYSEYLFPGDAKFLYMNASSPKILPDHSVDGYVSTAATPEYFNIGRRNFLGSNSTIAAGLPKCKYNFIGILNHNLKNNEDYDDTDGLKIIMNVENSSNAEEAFGNNGAHGDITLSSNCGGDFTANGSSIGFVPEYNGWGLTHFHDANSDEIQLKFRSLCLSWKNGGLYSGSDTNVFENSKTDLHIGSYILGRYYDTPHSPTMSLSMKREFDGIKKEVSTGGKEYMDIKYDSVEHWTQLLNPSSAEDNGNITISHKIPSMEFTGGNMLFNNEDGIFYGDQADQYMAKHRLGKKGKRVWSLAFDYFSDTDMWIGEEYSINIQNTFTEDGGSTTQPYDYSPQLNEAASFQWVWTHTLGGAIPFLFCPDKSLIESTDASERRLINENMAICTFDNSSLNVRQIAPNLYNVSVSIREL